ncbi:MAG: hypothetical protein RBT64_05105 [Trichloromonas sp.]|jgi:hypothetical protein|nr:hypothetical protein [Trichloromonas sp.]
MTLLFLRHLLGLLLTLSVAQSVAGWKLTDYLTGHVLRPALIRLVEYALDGEVLLARMELSSSRLTVADLAITRPEAFTIHVAEADIRFSLTGLWLRRIDAIRLHQPRVELAGLLPPADEDSSGFPATPPFEIALLRISDGALTVNLEDQRWELGDLHLDLHGTHRPRFEASARLGGEPGLPLVLAGEGSWEEHPALTISRFSWDGTPLLDAPVRFQLDSAGASVAGRARLPRLSRAELERVATTLALPLNLPEGFDFTAVNPELTLALQPGGLEVSMAIPAADVRQDQKKLTFEAFSLTLRRQQDRSWQGEGRLTLEQQAHTTFTARYDAGTLSGGFDCILTDSGALLGRFDPELRRQVTGGGVLDGKFSWSPEQLSVQANFTGRPLPGRGGDYLLDIAPLQLWLSLQGPPDRLKSEARLLLDKRPLFSLSGTLSHWRWRLEPVAVADLLPLSGAGRIPEALLSLREVAGSGELSLPPGGGINGLFDLKAAAFAASGLEADALFAGGEFRHSPTATQFRDLRFAGRLRSPTFGSGRLSGMADIDLEPKQTRMRLTRLEADAVELLSADGLSGLSGGKVGIRGEVRHQKGESAVNLDLDGNLTVGEVLHGAFYANLGAHEAELKLAGRADWAAQSFTAEELSLRIPELARVQLAGLVTPDRQELSGTLESAPLSAAFERYLRAPLTESGSPFKELALDGRLGAGLLWHRTPEGFSLAGHLEPRGLALTLPGPQLEIAGLNGRIPLFYQQGTLPAETETRSGRLDFDRFELGPLQLESGTLPLQAAPNRLTVAAFPQGRLAGGRMHLADLRAAFEESGLTLAARIRFEAIDLAQLSRELDWAPLSGRLNADLGEIRYADKTLSSAGTIHAELFGGTLDIAKIRVQDPLSRYRTLYGDIEFSGIDLQQLTQTFEFGEMNGILDGHIRDLRLFGTTPSHFSAELSTREEGRRNISVKALKNLSILSQGALAEALSQGIYRFIDFYRYQKIGIDCTLSNDSFRLRGTAREGEDSYLVYGGLLPPKIDIIAPERAISFKEMLKRISRLDRATR